MAKLNKMYRVHPTIGWKIGKILSLQKMPFKKLGCVTIKKQNWKSKPGRALIRDLQLVCVQLLSGAGIT